MLIGNHISVADFNDYMDTAAEYNFRPTAVQIFVSGPNNSKEISDENKDRVKEMTKVVSVYAHASYLDHLLGRRPGFTKINIRRELEICAELGVLGLCIHLPRASPEEIVSALVYTVGGDFTAPNVPLLLETAAVTTHTSTRFLIEVIHRAQKAIKVPIGIVLDTAHLFAGGLSVESPSEMQAWLDDLDAGLPNDTPRMLQLNDQKWEKGSESDEHMALGSGQIWNKSRRSLQTVIDWADRWNAPIILERKCTDRSQDYSVLFKLGVIKID